MSEPLYLQRQYRTANEPKVHPLVRKSFVFVPSAGMRLAPEILVLELMREVFFKKHYGDRDGQRSLDPDELDEERRYVHSTGERAVLHALRGRRKKTRQSAVQQFVAPAYPQLARFGWLRKSSDRVINNFLFAGPIAQSLWHRGTGNEDGKCKQQELVETIWLALLGHNSCLDQDLDGKELLAAALGPASFDADDDFDAKGELPKQNLLKKTCECEEREGDRLKRDSVIKGLDDELADRITQDLIASRGSAKRQSGFAESAGLPGTEAGVWR